MIYDYPSLDDPIRQGDIFIRLPRIEVSLEHVQVIENDGSMADLDWREITARQGEVAAIFPVRPVTAIVATQDCDATRARDITLCEIRSFREVERKSASTSAPKAWKNLITQHARINQKWFYLPPDEQIGFGDKMAVDFRVTLRVSRRDLETLRDFRRGRLNSVADEHFRERIGEFFRRYAYDEWYPLNSKELDAYVHEYPGTKPYPWQQIVNSD